jgi:hypothetical protein
MPSRAPKRFGVVVNRAQYFMFWLGLPLGHTAAFYQMSRSEVALREKAAMLRASSIKVRPYKTRSHPR